MKTQSTAGPINARVNYLPDHLYEVLGILRGQALELAGTGFEGRRMGHNQNVIS